MIKNGMPPIHPGEILREEFLVPLQTDTIAFAERLGVPAATVEAVVNERAPVTPELASKLAALFKTSEGFWLSLQATYEERSAAVARQAGGTMPACGTKQLRMAIQLHSGEPATRRYSAPHDDSSGGQPWPI